MRILKRPMFSKGGSTNSGIMDGLDRSGYAGGGTIGGGTIQGTDLGYRTGYANPASLVTSTGQPLTYKPSVPTGTGTGGAWQGPLQSPQMQAMQRRITAQTHGTARNRMIQSIFNRLGGFAGANPGTAMTGLTSLAFAPTAGLAYMNRPKTKEALEYMKSMNQSGVFDETAMEGEYEDYVEEFTALNDIEKYTPIKMSDFFKDTKELKEEITETEDLKKEIFEKTKETGVPGDGDKGMTYKKPGDGGIPDISIADAKETMSEKNKRYMEMMAPHMQKRMVADAFGAASEAFGKGTGNTGQTIANAISAAAKGMGGTKDIYDKVSMLTLQGEIAKDIEKSKGTKPNLMESKIEFLRNVKDNDGVRKYSESAIGDILTGAGEKTYEELFTETGSPDIASRRWAKLNYPDVVQTFSAADDVDADFIKKLKDGVYYVGMGKDGDRFFRVEGGKIDDKFSRRGIL